MTDCRHESTGPHRRRPPAARDASRCPGPLRDVARLLDRAAHEEREVLAIAGRADARTGRGRPWLARRIGSATAAAAAAAVAALAIWAVFEARRPRPTTREDGPFVALGGVSEHPIRDLRIDATADGRLVVRWSASARPGQTFAVRLTSSSASPVPIADVAELVTNEWWPTADVVAALRRHDRVRCTVACVGGDGVEANVRTEEVKVGRAGR